MLLTEATVVSVDSIPRMSYGEKYVRAYVKEGVKLSRSRSPENVARTIAATLSSTEPMTATLFTVDEIASRLLPHVVDVAREMGREMEDDGQDMDTAINADLSAVPASSDQTTGGGQTRLSAQDAAFFRDPRPGQQTAEDGHFPIAGRDPAIFSDPSSRHPKGGVGHGNIAGREAAITDEPNPAPKIKPSRAGVAGIEAVGRSIGHKLFDTVRLSNGRSVGDLRWYELAGLARQSRRDALLLKALQEHGTPSDTSARVRDLISENTLCKAVERAEKEAAQ